MCGIVGIAGKIFAEQEKMFDLMLMLDATRGPHSTGVMLHDSKNTELCKSLGTPWDLFNSGVYDKATRLVTTPTIMLGHNRWATTGKVTLKNAHPFDMPNLVGVHNGTLRSVHGLKDGYKFDVDSQALYHHMSHEGVEDTIGKLTGAYCLVWFDKVDNTINFIRNSERPLFLAHLANGSIAWASEKWMIDVGCIKTANQVKSCVLIDVDKLYSYYVGTDGTLTENPLHHGLELKQTPAVTYYNRGNVYEYQPKKPEEEVVFEVSGEFCRDNYYLHTSGTIIQGKNKGEAVRIYCGDNKAIRDLLIEDPEMVFVGNVISSFWEQGAYVSMLRLNTIVPLDVTDIECVPFMVNGVLMTEDEFDHKHKNGCGWCSSTVDVLDADDIVWNASETEFLCPGCAKDTQAQTYFC